VLRYGKWRFLCYGRQFVTEPVKRLRLSRQGSDGSGLRGQLRLVAAAFVALLALVAIAAGTIWWADWQGSRYSDWNETTWPGQVDAFQASLTQEYKENPGSPGQILYVSAPALGLKSTYATGDDIKPTDMVRVASNTKTFVAAAAMVLVERGELSLDGPIGQDLSPKTKSIMEDKGYLIDQISLRQLLNHTSGVPDFQATFQFSKLSMVPTAFGLSPHWTPDQQIWFGLTFGTRGEPGKTFVYSDTGYLIAAEIIQRKTGDTNIAASVRKLLNWPAIGAPTTYWEQLEPTTPGTRRAQQWRGGVNDTNIDASIDLYGGGGLVMSLSDLGEATRAVVRGNAFKDPDKSTFEMQVEGTVEGAGGYALGIYPIMVLGEKCWGHTGFWGTSAFHCPRLDITVARSFGQTNHSSDGERPIEVLIAAIAEKELQNTGPARPGASPSTRVPSP
jgi:D-alanyl-D-alanine carboxypeptidase